MGAGAGDAARGRDHAEGLWRRHEIDFVHALPLPDGACIGFHVRTLVKLGVTRAELEEALGVCVYMGGGPSLMYAADALSAFEQYATDAVSA